MQPGTPEALDQTVRAYVYDVTMRSGVPPLAEEVARSVKVSLAAVFESFQRLASARVLVLQPENNEILMANPFSAVPTPFRVEASGIDYFGNCIWDALGIPAMLGRDARITASCGDCGTAMSVSVDRDVVSGSGLLHFGVPARLWWKDIVFT